MSENSYKNTLCYADNSLVLIIDNITYQLENIKPSFIFEYDYLFFEPLINKYIRVLDNITYELTNEEKDDVNFYINHFDSSIDNEVYTYNDKFIYTGKILKSEAELEFISYTTIPVPEGMMVARFDKENNRLIVGTNDNLFKNTLVAKEVNLLVDNLDEEIYAKVRSRAKLKKCNVTLIDNNEAKVEFFENERAITPGQSVVFYNKDGLCLGGGIIK